MHETVDGKPDVDGAAQKLLTPPPPDGQLPMSSLVMGSVALGGHGAQDASECDQVIIVVWPYELDRWITRARGRG